MNRNELQAMRHYANEICKLLIGTQECLKHGCTDCGYYRICQTDLLLRQILVHECNKYNEKGELIDDNN